jgi:hypothetical protein
MPKSLTRSVPGALTWSAGAEHQLLTEIPIVVLKDDVLDLDGAKINPAVFELTDFEGFDTDETSTALRAFRTSVACHRRSVRSSQHRRSEQGAQILD